MRFRALTILTSTALGVCTLAMPSFADPELLPPPRELQSQPRPTEMPFCDRFAPAEFDQSLTKLKVERDALEADRKAAAKNVNVDRSTLQSADADFKSLRNQLKRALKTLQEERTASAEPNQLKNPIEQTPAEDPDPTNIAKTPTEPRPITPELEPIDPLALAQMQMRAEKYEASLSNLRKIDLQGKKANERGPIIFLTASCLLRVGKTDEAIPMLRDIANSRGDEQIAAYAQWQLEFIRWRKDMNEKLQNIRERRIALEKRL